MNKAMSIPCLNKNWKARQIEISNGIFVFSHVWKLYSVDLDGICWQDHFLYWTFIFQRILAWIV